VQRAARKTQLPEEWVVRTRLKFGRKTGYEENMDNSMPHSTRTARMLHTHR